MSLILTAAIVLARLVITDGRYEQWQELFFKQLEKATDTSWEDRGWTELGSDQALTFFHGKSRTSVVLRFTTTMNGNYDFAYAFTQQGSGKPMRIALAKGVTGKAPIIDNGKDLIAAIAKALGLEVAGGETVAASALTAAIKLSAASLKDAKGVTSFMQAASKRLKGGTVTKPVVREDGASLTLGFPLGNTQVESTWRQTDGDFALASLAVNGGSARRYLRLDVASASTPAGFDKAITDALSGVKWYVADAGSPVVNLK